MREEFGKLLNYTVDENIVSIAYEKNNAYVKVITKNIVNFFVPKVSKERKSKAIEYLDNNICNFTVEKKDGVIDIITEALIIKIYDEFLIDIYTIDNELICSDHRGERKPFLRRSGDYTLLEDEGHEYAKEIEYKVFVKKSMNKDTLFYGLGERTGSLNKRGYHYKNWNTDNSAPHAETFEALYKSIPFLIALEKGNAYGIFFDNHFETHFDMGKENSEYYYFSSVDGNIDYYFINGPQIKEVVERYTYLTGRTPLPAIWTLGYAQSRWAYANEERVMEIADSFREKGIPCDTIYLDIGYMDRYKVFTWNEKRFSNPQEIMEKLKEKGFKVVTIVDPGVKKEKGYTIYDEGLKNGYFATDKDGVVYVNKVWPGDAVYPDFMNSAVRNWWGNNQKIMLDSGIAGIWNDMNEPASFNGPLPDDVMFNDDGTPMMHKEAHNIYGHMMAKATYEGLKKATGKRPFVVTRACYSGTQKYSTVWTGDNQSTWEHLRMSLPMLMNLGLSGLAYCGTDVGGFGFDCTGELLSRWVQVGAFTPFFRNHTSLVTRDQEPWAFDEDTEEINKKYIKLRYKFIPYLYDAYRKCELDGTPILKPLLYNYQDDKNTYEINDEFLFGDNILVAPVVEAGARKRLVYLPEGDSWIDYWTKEEFTGGQYIIKDAPLDTCPIYIKAGSIIPIMEEMNYIGEKENKVLHLEIYSSKNGEGHMKYTHYCDDGESFNYRDGEYNEYRIEASMEEEVKVKINLIHDGYNKKYESYDYIIY